jgi:hypothetical protein
MQAIGPALSSLRKDWAAGFGGPGGRFAERRPGLGDRVTLGELGGGLLTKIEPQTGAIETKTGENRGGFVAGWARVYRDGRIVKREGEAWNVKRGM